MLLHTSCFCEYERQIFDNNQICNSPLLLCILGFVTCAILDGVLIGYYCD